MVTEKAPETQAERVATIRDIEREAARLAGEDAPKEIIFKDISPGRVKVPLWRIKDGREIRVPKYMLANVLSKRDRMTGEFIFAGKKSDAAEYKPGTVLCFMHANSPEQVILSEIGLSASHCPADHLRNNHSKRMHAKHRHKQEWEAFEEYLDDQKEAEAVARQERQLDATLALAGKAAAKDEDAVNGFDTKAHALIACDQCGKECKGNAGLSAHVRGAHGA